MATPMTQKPCFSLDDVAFAFRDNTPVLDISQMSVAIGERVFVYGPSGSGKSTLLGLIAGVLTPSRGAIQVLGNDLTAMSAARRDRLRAEQLGVIFQQFNLVPYLDLVDNVLLPCRFSSARAERVAGTAAARAEKARDMLARLGLEQEMANGQVASELSTGQQQRVAVARALIGSPSLVIADEPTSALDTEARSVFIDTLLKEASDASVVFVSHDMSLASHFDSQISIAEINNVKRKAVSGSPEPTHQLGGA
ncbi:MAG: ABC transporter ATP-binding protein [Pseudomonadota bacterium]